MNSIAGGHLSSMCYDNANRRLLAAVYQEEGYGANTRSAGRASMKSIRLQLPLKSFTG